MLNIQLILTVVVTHVFFHLPPKLGTNFYVRLIDGAARIFPTSHATTGNQTHVSSVAPLLRDINPVRFSDLATAAVASMTCYF